MERSLLWRSAWQQAQILRERVQAMDGIVQKAVELGVSAVQPLITERVVVRLGAAEAVRRRERWQKISLEAARQCGAAWVPDVRPPAFLTEWLAGAPAFDLVLIGSLQPGARPFRDAAAAWRGAPPSRAALVIGPEGDLSDAETGALLAAGGVPVRFGSTVLRVETAAVAGLALLRYELDAARAARPAP